MSLLLPPREQDILGPVRVIARGTLDGFVRNRVRAKVEKQLAKQQLDAWFAEVSRAKWKNSAEVKAQFGSAIIISAKRVVFNIKGNDYRLVAAITYRHQGMMIKWLGTHEEYDAIDVREVKYDEQRYADPTR